MALSFRCSDCKLRIMYFSPLRKTQLLILPQKIAAKTGSDFLLFFMGL